MTVVTRFAPSPTGRLHLGHAFAAWTAYQAAKENDGKFLLRIENIDASRCREEFINGIYEDLDWLGVKWDGEARIQSQHLDEYSEALDTLKNKGILYPCVCTRKEIEAEVARIGHAPHAGETVIYPGTCRNKQINLDSAKNFSWRLNVSKALSLTGEDLYFFDEAKGRIKARPDIYGDVILARKDAGVSYHLCSVWDDWKQGVTLVTRGEDLFESTHIHRLLQALFGAPVPAYRHHKLILDEHGQRLAKRNNSVTIKFLRDSGMSPADIFKRFSS